MTIRECVKLYGIPDHIVRYAATDLKCTYKGHQCDFKDDELRNAVSRDLRNRIKNHRKHCIVLVDALRRITGGGDG